MRPSTPSAATARTWSSEPMPPDAITGTPAARAATARGRSGARPGPVPPDVAVDERRGAEGGEARREIGRRERGRLGPARDAEPPVARVEPDRDATGMRPADGGREVGILDRDGAEDGARGACGEHGVDRGRVAEPAAHLHRDVDGGADRTDEVGLRGPSGARAVEVDDVEPARARGGEPARHRDRIVAVDRLAVEGALPEADAAAAAQVERRIDRHAPRTTPTKLSSMRSPTCWLFSGWNWQAKTLSRTTLDANSSPYGVVVATTPASRGTG